MFQSNIDLNLYNRDRKQFYSSLTEQLTALLSIEQDPVTNMAQTSAFIFQSIPDLNWAGFYLKDEANGLRLGPFQGKVACVHIPVGKGVCGTVAKTLTSIKVDDVHQFDGHIACDAASNSEIVVPIMVDGNLFGVLDIDSPLKCRFNEDDLAGFEQLAAAFVAATRFTT
jgi:GAF domain-containing protein